MATKPLSDPEWATDVGADIVDPVGKAITGWETGEKPPAQFFNHWMNLVYQWQQYLEDITDEHDPIVLDAVRKSVADTITAVKTFDTGGRIDLADAMARTLPLIKDNRDDLSVLDAIDAGGSLILETELDVEGEAVRWYWSANGGVWVSRNCSFDPATIEWTADDNTKPATLTKMGGTSLEFREQTTTAASWSDSSGWEETGGASIRSGLDSDGAAIEGFGSSYMVDTRIGDYSNAGTPSARHSLHADRLTSAWGHWNGGTQLFLETYNIDSFTVTGGSSNILQVDTIEPLTNLTSDYAVVASGEHGTSLTPLIFNVRTTTASRFSIYVYDHTGAAVDISAGAANIQIHFAAHGSNKF